MRISVSSIGDNSTPKAQYYAEIVNSKMTSMSFSERERRDMKVRHYDKTITTYPVDTLTDVSTLPWLPCDCCTVSAYTVQNPVDQEVQHFIMDRHEVSGIENTILMPGLSTRAVAESKIEIILDTLNDNELALLFKILREGRGMTLASANLQLQKAGWTL